MKIKEYIICGAISLIVAGVVVVYNNLRNEEVTKEEAKVAGAVKDDKKPHKSNIEVVSSLEESNDSPILEMDYNADNFVSEEVSDIDPESVYNIISEFSSIPTNRPSIHGDFFNGKYYLVPTFMDDMVAKLQEFTLMNRDCITVDNILDDGIWELYVEDNPRKDGRLHGKISLVYGEYYEAVINIALTRASQVGNNPMGIKALKPSIDGISIIMTEAEETQLSPIVFTLSNHKEDCAVPSMQIYL